MGMSDSTATSPTAATYSLINITLTGTIAVAIP